MSLAYESSGIASEPGSEEAAGFATARRTRLFRRIVVGVDGSIQADTAADLAGALALLCGAEVVLVNVFWAERGFAPEVGLVGPDPRPNGMRASDALLQRVRQRLPAGIKVSTVTAEGDAANEILATAERVNADLIAVGTHARGRVAQAVLGSVANAVMRKAGCPVLTVAHAVDPATSARVGNGPAVA